MLLLVNDECIVCDVCREECFSEVIEEGDFIYNIDLDRCIECYGYDDDELCCVSVCFVDVILLDFNNVESKEELKYKYESLKE